MLFILLHPASLCSFVSVDEPCSEREALGRCESAPGAKRSERSKPLGPRLSLSFSSSFSPIGARRGGNAGRHVIS